jgi:hypothetical protein
MAGLTSLLIGPWKKTGLLFGVSRGIGGSILNGLGSFQSVFLYRFLQTLFCTLIHEEIIPQKKSTAAAPPSKRILTE